MNFGNVTLDQLSKIIARNNTKAAKLGLSLSWNFIGSDTIHAKIMSVDRMSMDEKFPVDKELHFMIAEIQYWFWRELTKAEDLFNVQEKPVDTTPKKWVKGKGWQ